MASSSPSNVVVTTFGGHGLPFGERMKLFVKVYWKSLLVVITPLILVPLPIIKNTPDFKCLYVVLLMAVYWVSEALPLPVTAMIPIVTFPTMGILDSEPTCQSYMKGTNMMFIGGLMFAAGLQHSKIHKRVALKCIQIVGCSHRRLNFGLTFVTMFLSMWVSNAAAVTMMVPITEAVLEVLEQQGLGDMYVRKRRDPEENAVNGARGKDADEVAEPPTPSRITTCYFISIAYAASLGGTGTLIGTATNVTFKGHFESLFPDAPQVDFLYWMLYNVPPMVIMLFFIWLTLQTLYMGMFRPNSEDAKNVNLGEEGAAVARKVVDDQYQALGPMTWHETCAGILFIVAILLYFLRSPGFMLGWADVMTDMKVKDAVTAMFIVIMMFVLPSNLDFLLFFKTPTVSQEVQRKSQSRMNAGEKSDGEKGSFELDPLMQKATVTTANNLPTKPAQGIVTWQVLKDKIPWGLLFLLGGGFALAEGIKKSGMSKLISEPLTNLEVLPPFVILLIVVIICEFLTEFTSNVAIANIILPVLAELCVAIKLHPMYLMVPATIACSMAFHMPVGTPPNAIVAGVANINTGVMAIAGIGPKIVTTILTWAFFPTWGMVIYPDTKSFPDWAVTKSTVAPKRG